MLLPISVIAIVYLFFQIIHVTFAHNDDDGLELVFHERTPNDWIDVWHQESHSRCRDKLVRHLYWACEKDIYRLTRRNDINTGIPKKRNKSFPWLENYFESISMLKTRRLKKSGKGARGITAECCTRIGCTWEEYAEYCPSNKRKNHNRN